MRRTVIAIGIGLFVIVISCGLMTPWRWAKLDADVRVSGQRFPGATVFRSYNDDLLVVTWTVDSGYLYLVNRKDREVGIPNLSEFMFIGSYAFSKSSRPKYAPMFEADSVPEIVTRDNLIEFKGVRKIPIEVRVNP
jgi:hypothetical protein